jgi:REP element-mobilizing transposase RayT
MSHTYTNLLYHVVFSTKERRPFISPDVKPRLHAYLGGIANEIDCIPLKIGGVADHVHLLLKIPPKLAVSEVLRLLKCNSSGWVHREFPQLRSFAWQEGYGAFTVSASKKPDVETYIANQEEHHRQRSFQDEFLSLLERHEVEFDPLTIWD